MDKKTDQEKVVNAIPLMLLMGFIISAPIIMLAGTAFWQRSQINNYLIRLEPVMKKAEKSMNVADLMWDRDFFKETFDPLTKGSDPVAIQKDIKDARKDLAKAHRELNRAEAEFRKIKTPRDGHELKNAVQDYFKYGNKFLTDMEVVLAHFDKHAVIEGKMDTAIDNAKSAGSDVNALAARDQSLDQEMKNLEKMVVPGSMSKFHEHKTAWFARLVELLKESTAAAAARDNDRLDQLGIDIEQLAVTGDQQFKEDLEGIRNGNLTQSDDRTAEFKIDMENEISSMILKYRL
jgi:hypothetical protein